MSETKQQTRALMWSALQRLQFIEFRLLWEGHVNRSDLITAFGISVPQSTLDFREYNDRAPGNMEYDKRRRYYFPTTTFKPLFISDSADGYLSQLAALDITGKEHVHPSWIGATPPFDVLPSPERRTDRDTLLQLLKALREKLAIKIHYQSLSTDTSVLRWISPHALASDGLRWHVRAFCHTKEEFRDFVLGRIIEVQAEKPSDITTTDLDWIKNVKVVIAPNPDLSLDQKKIIERDYAMIDGKAEIIVRRALLFYLKLRLGVVEGTKKTPSAQQVVIVEVVSIE